ncbi:unnamed protein product, partial [Ectocarpus sp. 12 AP-2014]
MLLARSRAPQGTGGTQISCWVWGDRCRRGGRLCAACGRPPPVPASATGGRSPIDIGGVFLLSLC